MRQLSKWSSRAPSSGTSSGARDDHLLSWRIVSFERHIAAIRSERLMAQRARYSSSADE
jgi:hypothetical protein